MGTENPGSAGKSWDGAGGAGAEQEEPGSSGRSRDPAGGAGMEREEPGSSGRSRDQAGGAGTQREEPTPGAGAAPASAARPGLAAPPAATLALRSMDGVFLSPTEDEFVGRIAEELEHFMVQGQHQRVLLFPPLSSRLRYLIHRTVENMELLSSFSVGEGWRRRTVICHSAVRLPKEPTSDQKPGHVAGRAQRPGQPWGRGGRGPRLRPPGDPHGDNSRAPVGSGRIFRPARRKPDKALFVPKSTRKKSNWRERDNDGDAAPGGENRPRNSMGDAQQEEGKGGNCPGKRQEPEEGNVQDGGSPGKRQEPEEGNVQDGGSPGKQQEPEEGNVQDGGSPGKRQEPEEGNVQDGGSPGKQQEPEEGNVQDGGSPGKRQEPEEGNVQDGGSAEHPLSDGKEPSLGNSQDSCEQGKDCSHSLSPGHSKHPPKAGEREFSRASTVIPEGSESQLPEEKQPSRGESSFPLENHSWTKQSQESKACRAAGTDLLESQSLESSRSQSPPAEQHLGNAQGGGRGNFSTLENLEQENPGTAQLEQKPLQKVLEGPGEALAAPGAADPGAPERIQAGKVPREEEEEEEEEQEPTEGTRQSSLQEECTAELLAEIMGNLTVKDISIERISLDYPSSGEPQLTEGDLGHVTEIHDFPSSLKTEELMEMFSDFHESGFKIHWVDDTHALGIFSSPSTASQALGRRYPCLKIRPLIHATKQSKIRALQRPKLLQLGKERPQTDTAVARRLVSHALGWRNRQQEPAGSEVFQPESLDQQE